MHTHLLRVVNEPPQHHLRQHEVVRVARPARKQDEATSTLCAIRVSHQIMSPQNSVDTRVRILQAARHHSQCSITQEQPVRTASQKWNRFATDKRTHHQPSCCSSGSWHARWLPLLSGTCQPAARDKLNKKPS